MLLISYRKKWTYWLYHLVSQICFQQFQLDSGRRVSPLPAREPWPNPQLFGIFLGMRSYLVIWAIISYKYEIRILNLKQRVFHGKYMWPVLFSCFNLLNLLRNFYWKLKMQISLCYLSLIPLSLFCQVPEALTDLVGDAQFWIRACGRRTCNHASTREIST